MKDTIVKRRNKEGYLFFNEDRTYRSRIFSSSEAREKAIDKYIEEQTALNKETELRRKQEKELLLSY